MLSLRFTLSVVAALVYGTSALALPLENSYDVVERDYNDLAELDARIYDMNLEEYYVREGEATPPVAIVPTKDGVPALSTRQPKDGKGRKGKKGQKGKGQKGKGKKGGAPPSKAAAALVDASAIQAHAARDLEVNDEVLSVRVNESKGGQGGKSKGKGKGQKGKGKGGKGKKGKGGKGKEAKGGKGKAATGAAAKSG